MQHKATMPTLYCRDCKKQYRVKDETIALMQRMHPGTVSAAGGIFRYRGGCFFKTLARFRREDGRGEQDAE